MAKKQLSKKEKDRIIKAGERFAKRHPVNLAAPEFIPIRAVDKDGVETPLPGAESVTFVVGARVVKVKVGFGPTIQIECADARPVPCAGNHRSLAVELYP